MTYFMDCAKRENLCFGEEEAPVTLLGILCASDIDQVTLELDSGA